MTYSERAAGRARSAEPLILGIESSCDETAAAVVQNGRQVLSNVISSQIDLHTLFGVGNLNLGWAEALIVFVLAADVLYSAAAAFLNYKKEEA